MAVTMITNDEKKEAEAIAELIGVKIDGQMSAFVWMLPILRDLAERVISLENEVFTIKMK